MSPIILFEQHVRCLKVVVHYHLLLLLLVLISQVHLSVTKTVIRNQLTRKGKF